MDTHTMGIPKGIRFIGICSLDVKKRFLRNRTPVLPNETCRFPTCTSPKEQYLFLKRIPFEGSFGKSASRETTNRRNKMNSRRCINLNHRRASSPIRMCAMCGEVLNHQIPSKECSADDHAEKRKHQNMYCCDCGEYLLETQD